MFSIFFLRKTNQKLDKSIFSFYFYKTYQKPHKSNKHLLCHNLLGESVQGSVDDLRVFYLICLQISIIQNFVSDFTCFFIYFLQISIIRQL